MQGYLAFNRRFGAIQLPKVEPSVYYFAHSYCVMLKVLLIFRIVFGNIRIESDGQRKSEGQRIGILLYVVIEWFHTPPCRISMPSLKVLTVFN